MADIVALKDYLKKLQKIINFEATFTFSHWKLIKKTRIDDIMCCIYATLPDTYKRRLKTKLIFNAIIQFYVTDFLQSLLQEHFFLTKIWL